MNRCDFCGFNHNPEYDPANYEQFKVKTLRSIFSNPNLKKNVSLYYQSDPFNFEMPIRQGGKIIYSYLDIDTMYTVLSGDIFKPFVSTVVPKGKEEIILEGIMKGRVDRISVSHMNRQRLINSGFFDKIRYIKYLKNELRMIKSMADEYLSEQEYVELFEKKQVELMDKLLNLKREDMGKKVSINKTKDMLDYLKQIYIENIHQIHDINLEITPLTKINILISRIGGGFSNNKYISNDRGIGCYYGTLITPQGLFNIVQLEVSEKFKAGQIVLPINTTFPKQKFPISASVEEVMRQGIVRYREFRDLKSKDYNFEIYNPQTKITAKYDIVGDKAVLAGKY